MNNTKKDYSPKQGRLPLFITDILAIFIFGVWLHLVTLFGGFHEEFLLFVTTENGQVRGISWEFLDKGTLLLLCRKEDCGDKWLYKENTKDSTRGDKACEGQT